MTLSPHAFAIDFEDRQYQSSLYLRLSYFPYLLLYGSPPVSHSEIHFRDIFLFINLTLVLVLFIYTKLTSFNNRKSKNNFDLEGYNRLKTIQ
jgi:hypothetical protein